jgi:HlyD family secretion protein
MDKPRSSPRKKRSPLYIGGGIVLAVLITVGLSQLKPAPPSVDGAAIYSDTVRHGELVRQVRGPGTLTPEHIRIIPASRLAGWSRSWRVPVRSSSRARSLLRLSNPDVELQLLESERQYTAAQTELVNLRANLQTQVLMLEGVGRAGAEPVQRGGAAGAHE